MGAELVPDADPAKLAAVERALAGLDDGTPSPWWRAGLVDALENAPSDAPRSSAYEAARSPRSTLGAKRA
jgi:hypothetical protein